MSCYQLSRLLFDLKMKESCVKRALTDFESVMGEYDLTTEEKDALRAGDPRKLRQLGVHGMLAFTSNVFIPSFATTFTGSRSEIRVHSVPHRTECAVKHVGRMLGSMIENPAPFLKR